MIRSLLAGAVATIVLASATWSSAHAGSTKLLMSSGASFEGQILSGNVNTITINLDVGGYTILPRAEIDQISVTANDGQVIEGSLYDWQEGICTIQSGNSLITVVDGIVTAVRTDQVVKSAAAPPPQPPTTPIPALPVVPLPPDNVEDIPPSSVVNKPTM